MSEPLRVAHVMGKMVGGGVESVVMNYYRHIDRSRVQFDLLVDSDSTLVPRGEVESLGGRVIEVPPYQRLPLYMRELEKLFRRERWPIVHSHINSLSCFPLCAAKRAGVPVRIAHSHSTGGRGEFVRNASKRILRTQANRYPTHRLACSQYAGEWLFGKSADFQIVRNAIELDSFFFDGGIRMQVRAELGLTDSDFVIGHVGRFVASKNHRFLIDVFAQVLQFRPESLLLLVGDGALRSLVERQAVERGVAGRVRFFGQRDDVDRLYQAFDAFALPSLYEGLGMVAIEAQAAGLPCFLSDQITSEVDVTGTARFLPIYDPRVWADALCEVTSSLRLDVRPNNLADYDIAHAGRKLTVCYLDCTKGILRGR